MIETCCGKCIWHIHNGTDWICSCEDSEMYGLEHIMKLLPPPGEKEIFLIKNNPSLSIFQKHRLIKIIRGNGVKAEAIKWIKINIFREGPEYERKDKRL